MSTTGHHSNGQPGPGPVCRSIAPAVAALVFVVSGPAGAQSETTDSASAADRIVVDKSERALYVYSGADVLKRMHVSLGLVPDGDKEQEGDFRTPEGVYYIEAKNTTSDYFLSLKISYPDAGDRERARRLGVDPGGQIMIHGLPNEPKYAERSYLETDWTDGCIAVSNSDMIDLWLMTAVSTPIEIRP